MFQILATCCVKDERRPLKIGIQDRSQTIYSIVETVKQIFTYLNYLHLYMPGMGYRNYPEVMEDMMHWCERVQRECKE